MNSIYKSAMDELLKLVESSVDKLIINHSKFKEELNPIIKLGDKRLSEYSSIVSANENRVTKIIENIAVSLFEKNNISCFNYYPIDKQYANLPKEEQLKSLPFKIILTEKGKKYGVIFSNTGNTGNYYHNFKNKKYPVDALKIVRLCLPNDFTKQCLFTEVNELNKNTNISIEYITISDFWQKYFGEKSFNELKNFCEEFNTKANPIIGFNTIVVPTEKALNQFKNKCGNLILQQKISYIKNIPNSIYDKQIEKIVYNYYDRGLWKCMIGKADFAVSFITSEWFYNMYNMTENLDLTNIVSGYLKSIEQLIFSIINLSEDKNITINSKNREKVYFDKNNIDNIDTTLWSLTQVLKNNSCILDINKYARDYLCETINEWRDKERNQYFHLTNLYDIEKVKEIREKTFYLYFLILGSCTIQKDQFSLLGIIEEI